MQQDSEETRNENGVLKCFDGLEDIGYGLKGVSTVMGWGAITRLSVAKQRLLFA